MKKQYMKPAVEEETMLEAELLTGTQIDSFTISDEVVNDYTLLE